MTRTLPRLLCLLGALVVPVLGLASPAGAAADDVVERRVLVLFSYHPTFGTTDDIIDGIREGIGEGVVLEFEFMDTKRHFDPEHFANFDRAFTHKLEQREPYDAVIVSDDNALRYAIDNEQRLFGETPIVFLAVNSLELAAAMNDNPFITGVVEGLTLDENLKLVERLWPDARHFYAIVDDTESGLSDQADLDRVRGLVPDLEIVAVDTTDFTWDEFGEYLRTLPRDSVVTRMAAFRDENGVVLAHEEITKILVENLSVPSIAVRELDVGAGSIGGHVLSFFEQGRQAGLIAREVLDGRPISDLEVSLRSSNRYVFDYDELQRAGVDVGDLPDDSVVLNEPISIFDAYEREIRITLAFIAFLLLLIAYLAYQIAARVRAEKQLLKHRDELELMVQTRTSELLDAKDEAERANAAKSEFLSRMSHELRTPMNAILGFSQVMEIDDADPLTQGQRSNLREIQVAGEHLLELINEVLDLARIEAGRLVVSIEDVSPAELIHDCVSLLRPLAATRQIPIETSDQVCDLTVRADSTRLRQVILNLLSNAIKYNIHGGAVRVDCAVRGDRELRIEVHDTGRGLTPDQQAVLFQPFERLDADHQGIEGAGIGLALSKRLVEVMDGSIGVESSEKNGTTFWVELPLSAPRQPSVDELGDDRTEANASR